MSRKSVLNRRQKLSTGRTRELVGQGGYHAVEHMVHAGSAPIQLDLRNVRTDGGTQPRVANDVGLIAEYAERMSRAAHTGLVVDPEGKPWEALTVFFDKDIEAYWLADGFHRFNAARAADLGTFQAKVMAGTQRDAVYHSLGVNEDHGKRRTRQDKRRAVSIALRDEEWGGRTDAWVAKMCKVTSGFVGEVRRELELCEEIRFREYLVSADDREFHRAPPVDHSFTPNLSRARRAPRVAARGEETSRVPRFEELADIEGAFRRVVAFPTSEAEYFQLIEALEHLLPKEREACAVLVPLATGSSWMWKGPMMLDVLTREYGFAQPELLEFAAHDRPYLVWTRHLSLGRALADASAFLDDAPALIAGQALGGWT
ncbi:MAG: hypothetical protein AAGI01_03560 [Myxococcota bacterium]